MDPDLYAYGGDKYNRNLLDHPEDAQYDACWTSVVELDMAKPQYSVCVANAIDEDDAASDCETLCNDFNTLVKDACTEPDCDVLELVDCVLSDGAWTDASGMSYTNDTLEHPAKVGSDPDMTCDGEPIVVQDGDKDPFVGGVSFTTPEGMTASIGEFRGLIGHSLSNCNTTTCDIVIHTLVTPTTNLSGAYADATGNGGLFTLGGVGFQALEPFSGVYYNTRGSLVFPTAEMNGQAWYRSLTLDGMPISSGHETIPAPITQIVGSRTSSGAIVLNLTYNLSSMGTIHLSLRSIPN
ncbi:hypothetical protein [Nannocystis pusilla]|uniref:Uncharacterized protein n=1 Tax=Nannocystis pusilla TaxID=889268 RepID=A0ABS7TNF4_9BACT|nr:hypothetical protein [Nannocystis pusilla]MBZ5709763.1 hypothetical protein [Nannocystis pusilla]